MKLEEAKREILEFTEQGNWVEIGPAEKFVRLCDQDQDDSAYIEALRSLIKEGALKQIPTAGQVRSTVSFRRTQCVPKTY